MGQIENLVKVRLLEESEEEYRKFSSSLLPGINNVLGVRLPKLRKFAKELLNYDYNSFLNHAEKYMEEVMLQGMLIGLIKELPETKLKRIKIFLPKIDNWSVCDSFCCSLKFTKTNQKLVWDYISTLITSEKEYYVRFALVMMLDYFVNEQYIDKVLEAIIAVKHDGYYAKMAAAWAMSICYIRFPLKTTPYMEKLTNKEIKTITVRKICDSYQVSKEDKKKLKQLKL